MSHKRKNVETYLLMRNVQRLDISFMGDLWAALETKFGTFNSFVWRGHTNQEEADRYDLLMIPNYSCMDDTKFHDTDFVENSWKQTRHRQEDKIRAFIHGWLACHNQRTDDDAGGW